MLRAFLFFALPMPMIAFFLPPEVAEALAVPDGEAAGDLHLTLAVFEDGVEVEAARQFLEAWAVLHPPVEGLINGVGRFNSDEELEPFYASFDAPLLPAFRQDLLEALAENGFVVKADHGFTPHITLAYVAKDAPDPFEQVERLPVTFAAISLATGGEPNDEARYEFPLKAEPPERSIEIFGERRMPQFLRAYRQDDQAADPGKPGDPIPFIASTGGIKRDGLNLDQSRWDLTNYQRNPVFLWSHNYGELPLGRTEVAIEGGQLRCNVRFDQEDEFALKVERKYRARILNAVSIGWDVVDSSRGEIYDLLDISAVAVPIDPDALIERQRVYLRGLRQDIDKLLAGDDDDAGQETGETPDPLQRVIPLHTTEKATTTRAWDGPGEVSQAEASEEVLRGMHAWVDIEADPNTRRAYKSPHHLHTGEVVWRGVATEMLRLCQAGTKIPEADHRGVYDHLARHYQDFDQEPPEFRMLLLYHDIVDELDRRVARGDLAVSRNGSGEGETLGEVVARSRSIAEMDTLVLLQWKALLEARELQATFEAVPEMRATFPDLEWRPAEAGGERAGKTLSKRNLNLLRTAQDNIQKVIDSAGPPESEDNGRGAGADDVSNEAGVQAEQERQQLQQIADVLGGWRNNNAR